MRFQLPIVVLLTLIAVPAWADAPSGVFGGKLGRSSVVACFGADLATYYYVRIGTDIALAEKAPGVWEEANGGDPPTGTWRLAAMEGDALTGTWKSPKGKRHLPIKLKRIGEVCLSADFAHIVSQRKPGKPETTAGLTIRPFVAVEDSVFGVEILGGGTQLAGLKRSVEELNHALMGNYSDCMTYGEGWSGTIEFSGGVAIEAITEHFVVVGSSVSYWCGGPHPDDSDKHFVFERSSGQEIGVDSWLKVDSRTIARERWGDSDQEGCGDAVSDRTSFQVWPTPAGMKLAPELPHALAACGGTVVASWDSLSEQLTPAGKRAADEFAALAK